MIEVSPIGVFGGLKAIFSTEPSYSAVEAERKRQARRFLARGCELLEKKRFNEADIQFAVATILDDHLLMFLSKRKRRKLKFFLAKNRGGSQAPKIWAQLDRLDELRRFELFRLKIRYKLHH